MSQQQKRNDGCLANSGAEAGRRLAGRCLADSGAGPGRRLAGQGQADLGPEASKKLTIRRPADWEAGLRLADDKAHLR